MYRCGWFVPFHAPLGARWVNRREQVLAASGAGSSVLDGRYDELITPRHEIEGR